ncbi:hypothetical protein [Shouchella clausii]|uniref:hypothetical protein n=1 Tax=Shouchella clausii TaxID=79880 RepID=UPI001C72A648|nr:hypothetical protein [Shouchella clausii]MBX0320201.1 hypothetical protein [Shouchella clausii]MEB5480784.1 hypothetical protein [Shouchella clausii]
MAAYVQGTLTIRFELKVHGENRDEVMERTSQEVNELKDVCRVICVDTQGKETMNLSADDYEVEIENVEMFAKSKKPLSNSLF